MVPAIIHTTSPSLPFGSSHSKNLFFAPRKSEMKNVCVCIRVAPECRQKCWNLEKFARDERREVSDVTRLVISKSSNLAKWFRGTWLGLTISVEGFCPIWEIVCTELCGGTRAHRLRWTAFGLMGKDSRNLLVLMRDLNIQFASNKIVAIGSDLMAIRLRVWWGSSLEFVLDLIVLCLIGNIEFIKNNLSTGFFKFQLELTFIIQNCYIIFNKIQHLFLLT